MRVLNPDKTFGTHNTCAIDMIASAFGRYDVTLSNDNKINMATHLGKRLNLNKMFRVFRGRFTLKVL